MPGRKTATGKDTETYWTYLPDTEGESLLRPYQLTFNMADEGRANQTPDKSSGEVLSAIHSLKKELMDDFVSKLDTVI